MLLEQVQTTLASLCNHLNVRKGTRTAVAGALGFAFILASGCSGAKDLEEDPLTRVAALGSALTSSADTPAQPSGRLDNLREAIEHVRSRASAISRTFAPSFIDKVDAAISTGEWGELANADGPTQWVKGRPIQLASDFVRLSELGTTLRARKDPDNLSRYYRLAYEVAPAAVQAKYWRAEEVANLDLISATNELDSLLTDLANGQDSSTGPSSVLRQPPTAADCTAEAGYRMGLDGISGTCSTYGVVGIMRNVDFALRDHLTCVRDQGFRGTCYAFAVAGAIETAVHVQNGNKINLSEQHLVWKGETTTDWANRYAEGVSTSDLLSDMMKSGYQVPKEKMWPYNPSRSRTFKDGKPIKDGKAYPFSCVDYPWTCTDFAFQGEERVDPSYTYPDPIPNAGAFGVSNATQLTLDGSGLALAKMLLEKNRPLVAWFVATPNFMAPGASGYVAYDAHEDVSDSGSHATLVAGWIDNENLPSGAPLGSGGGYFVLKNSWGEFVGDCGYFYVPFDFLLTYGVSLTAVEVF